MLTVGPGPIELQLLTSQSFRPSRPLQTDSKALNSNSHRIAGTELSSSAANVRRSREDRNLRGLRESPRSSTHGLGIAAASAPETLLQALLRDLRWRLLLPNRALRRRPSEESRPYLGIHA